MRKIHLHTKAQEDSSIHNENFPKLDAIEMYDGKEPGTDLMEVGTPPQPSYVVTAFPLPVCNLEMNYLKTGQLDRNYTHTHSYLGHMSGSWAFWLSNPWKVL